MVDVHGVVGPVGLAWFATMHITIHITMHPTWSLTYGHLDHGHSQTHSTNQNQGTLASNSSHIVKSYVRVMCNLVVKGSREITSSQESMLPI